MIKTLLLASTVLLLGASPVTKEIPAKTIKFGNMYVKQGEKAGPAYRVVGITPDQMDKYLESPQTDPTDFCVELYVGVPIVMADGEVRSIYIEEVYQRPMYTGSTPANALDKRLVELAKSGHERYVVGSPWLGNHIFARSKQGLLMISPVDSFSAASLSMPREEPATYPLVKFDDVAERFKASAKKIRTAPPPPPPDPHAGHDHD